MPSAGPSAHGPTEPPVVTGQAAHPEARERDGQQRRRGGDHQAREHDRQLEQQQREHAPERAVAELLADAAGGGRRR